MRVAIEAARETLKSGGTASDTDAIAAYAVEILHRKSLRSLRGAINATGIILHTGLGRAPLSQAAQDALTDVIAGYSNVQADVGSGERMQREVHVESLVQEITGAEAVAVVNNNAAATVLVLNTLAAGKEVIVSRGELVEIGGAFRLPDIIALSGCRMVEVGCTNRTHLRDYRNAITADTALLLAVHQSNYRITGFTAQPEIGELVTLAHERNIHCAHDLGSGALLDLRQLGLPHEPNVLESLAAGADVGFFSGDKLIGGPQCGIILGRVNAIEAMRKNPFYRTFRVDKLTLSALEGTLRLFLDPETLTQRHRLMSLLTCPLDDLRTRAMALTQTLNDSCNGWLHASTEEGESEIGGGSLAGHTIPTYVVRLRSSYITPDALAAKLRLEDTPIFARVHGDAVLLDIRTIFPEQDNILIGSLHRISLLARGER